MAPRAALSCMALGWLPLAASIDNGRGITPPRGWRSWDGSPPLPPPTLISCSALRLLWGAAFENSVNQTLQTSQVDALVDRSRAVDGTPTSLLDLGYNRIVRPHPTPTPQQGGLRRTLAGRAGAGRRVAGLRQGGQPQLPQRRRQAPHPP